MAFWIPAAIIGSSLLGAASSAKAGKQAASAQTAAANQSNAETRRQFDISTQMQMPWQQAGANALNLRNASLGLPQVSNTAGSSGFANGGQPTMGQRYLDANPDVRQYFLSNPGALAQFGGDLDAAAEYHFNTFGRSEGRTLPEAPQPTQAGAPGAPTTTQDAYGTFLDSGYARSMLNTTENDMAQITAAMGAAGKSVSGSALGALNDRNRRNTNAAYTQWDNALAGISGTGQATATNMGQQGMQVAGQIGNNNMNAANARGSSYMNTAGAINSGLQNTTNALAYGYGQGWFGGGGGSTAPAGRVGSGYTDMRGWG